MEPALSHDPIKSDDVPATQRHLELVRQELKSDITSFHLEMRAGFQAMDARFQSIDARFKSIDARFQATDAQLQSIDARFQSIDARFMDMESRFTKIDGQFLAIDARFERLESILLGMKAMMEEQNSRNRYVLDGYNFLFNKFERSEKRLEKVEQKVFGIEQD